MRRYSYVCNVTTPCGAVVTHLVGGSSALAALHNLRRSLKGAWLRIEVGTGTGMEFRCLQEVER